MSDRKGKVYIIGAGPGDEGLITIKAVECLKKSDVIIYDYLVNKELLKHCKPDSEKFFVGKKSSCHTKTQDEINSLLVNMALQGKTVARIKGGDPYIFGRGGEEALELVSNKIEFEVIPGVTAATASCAYAGISLTQRGYTSTLAFISGHEYPGKNESDVDWSKISTGIGTLVFYMGVSNLPQITRKLIENGRHPGTPVALIRWGTYNNQETVTGTLENIAIKVKEQNFKPPAIIVVGEVVELRENLRWFDNKPLFGKKIIITKSRAQDSSFKKALCCLGVHVIEFPTIDIQPVTDFSETDVIIYAINTFSWIIFTSVNSVEIFMDRLFHLNFDSRAIANTNIAVTGKETVDTLKKYGIVPDLVPEKFTPEEVIIALKNIKTDLTGDKILLPGSATAWDYIPGELKKMGADVTRLTVYKNIISEYTREQIESVFTDDVDIVAFTSSSTATNLVKIFKDYGMDNLIPKIRGASIGPVTSETVRTLGIPVLLEAKSNTIRSFVETIEKCLLNN